jgi:hypothetical protein
MQALLSVFVSIVRHTSADGLSPEDWADSRSYSFCTPENRLLHKLE